MRLTPAGYKKFGPGAPVSKPTRAPVKTPLVITRPDRMPGKPPTLPGRPKLPTPGRGSEPRPIIKGKGRGKPKGGPALRKAMLKQAALKKMRRR